MIRDSFKLKKSLAVNRKFAVLCLGILLVLGSATLIYKKLYILKQVDKEQSVQIDHDRQIIELLNKRLIDLNSELDRQSKKIDDFKKDKRRLKKTINALKKELAAATNPIQSGPMQQVQQVVNQAQGSVYDRISTNDATARQMVVDALKIIENNTPAYFSKLQRYAAEIVPTTSLGCQTGFQSGHTIYIGYKPGNCLLFLSRSVIASILIHEVTHIINVYVNGVVSSGTAEQELPSYYAQRETFSALGVPQYYRDIVNDFIAKWEAEQ